MFTKAPTPTEVPEVERDGERWVVRRDGQIVCWANSSRQNSAAAELGVETELAYRRCGLARQVCAAWAADVLGSGRLAFYSHELSNVASAGLAAALGVAFAFESGGLDPA